MFTRLEECTFIKVHHAFERAHERLREPTKCHIKHAIDLFHQLVVDSADVLNHAKRTSHAIHIIGKS